MSWERILQNDVDARRPLSRRIEALFAEQRLTWPALRDGEAALAHLRTKMLTHEGSSIVVQANPGRQRSTMAKVDTKSIADRPCFLCPKNMPAEERGVAFENLVILPNPYPILPQHCTIADRDHSPQRLAGRIGTLLRLAGAIGPELAAFYNGPRCGASAPDHFHFQACQAAPIPILSQLPLRTIGHERISHRSFARPMLIFASANFADVQADIERALEALGRQGVADPEPMVNLLVHYRDGRFVAILFRAAHIGPSVTLPTAKARLAISPAVLEMAGVLVVAEPDDFNRVSVSSALAIYQEVGLDRAQFGKLAAVVV